LEKISVLWDLVAGIGRTLRRLAGGMHKALALMPGLLD